MEYENITKDKNAIIYKRMSVGETQHTVFKEGDLPPYFFPDQLGQIIFDNKIIRGYVNEPKGLK